MFQLQYNLGGEQNRKRPHDFEDEVNELSKRVVNKSFIRLLVNTKSLGYLIGKSGVGVEEIRVRFVFSFLFNL